MTDPFHLRDIWYLKTNKQTVRMKRIILLVISILGLNSLFAQTVHHQAVTGTAALYKAGTLTHDVPGSPTPRAYYVLLEDGKDKILDASIGINRTTAAINKSMEFQVFINFIDDNGIIQASSDIKTFTESDFSAPNGTLTSSGLKTSYLRIHNAISLPGRLVVTYRVRDAAGVWSDDFYNEADAIRVVVKKVTQFSGPDKICTSGTYTIINPGTVTLENAAGTATLTKINESTYKVTRIGNSNYSIASLKSVIDGTTYSKSITIGEHYSINGYNTIGYDGLTYSFLVGSGGPGTTYSWDISGLPVGATIEDADQPLVKIKMPSWRRGNPTGGTIIMNVTINGPCTHVSVSKQITYGTVSGGGGGGGGGGPIIKQPDLP
jgi:hypothetical protein